MRGKSNVIKMNVEKVRGARYLPKNTVLKHQSLTNSTERGEKIQWSTGMK
jgi:hypothetical protein